MKYRADIDGIRAIAVMCVVFFHLSYAWMPGGFVGVDVFFVISGFLITRIILTNIAAETFSFTDFYGRRARRLAPAFLATVAFSFAAGAILFTPQDLSRLGKEILSSVTGLANIYYWNNSGYFAGGVSVQPLLHTWSLAVEEQFYLIWPVLLVMLSRVIPNRAVLLSLSLIAMASMSFAELNLSEKRDAVFFLTPFRIWEFFMGAMLCWLPELPPRNKALGDLIVFAGLAMIMAAATLYNSSQLFPGLAALLPCAGVSLVIIANSHGLSRFILGNRLIVAVGKISYSLYLVHWPVITFFTYFKFNFGLSSFDKIIVILISFGLAMVLYFFVEQPFRRRGKAGGMSSSAFGLGCAAATIAIMFMAADAWASLGWSWRVPSQLQPSISGYGACVANSERRVDHCVVGAKRGPTVLVIGDSHARHLVVGLDKFGQENGIIFSVHTVPSCIVTNFDRPIDSKYEQECREVEKVITAELAKSPEMPIILAQRWRSHYAEFAEISDSVSVFLAVNKRHPILVVGPVPQPPKRISSCGQLPPYIFDNSVCALFERDKIATGMSGRLAAIAANAPNAKYADPSAAMCKKDSCIGVDKGQPNYIDEHHLSAVGSLTVVLRSIGPELKLLKPEYFTNARLESN